MNFNQISLTAKLAAYMRQFTDIPFAKDVAERLHAQEAFETLLHDHQMRPEDLLWYAPIFEARYKSIAAVIRQLGAKQVLELASGLSLRGLAMTRADPSLIYVESDLEALTAEKAALVVELRQTYRLPDHGNYHLVVADALDLGQLRAAARWFRHDRPVAVVNEGLFPYLDAGEMETVARNVRTLLDEYGGTWITPDFTVKADVKDVSDLQRRFRAVVAAATERKMHNNAFERHEDVLAFLDRLGFQTRLVRQVDEVPELVSVERLHLQDETVSDNVQKLNLWINDLK